MNGCVFNIQRFSTDDGGGIRTCVFLKGCPLRCVWCHNAEGLSFAPELAFYQDECLGCGLCVKACPNRSVTLQNERAEIDRSACIACGACADACPSGALVTVGKTMIVDEVMKTVKCDAIFYGKNGGMTITGGEPMAQAEFTLALAKAAKEAGISVAVETSGYGRTEDFRSLIPYCDLFLFDCKASKERHRELIGVEDTLILRNLDTVCRGGASVILRCPIVPGANWDEAFEEKIVSLALAYPRIRAVQLMPYHAIGAEKSICLGGVRQATFSLLCESDLAGLASKIEQKTNKPAFW